MEAFRRNRTTLLTAVALTGGCFVGLCACAEDANPEGVIRLPAWIDPSAEQPTAKQAAFEAAPRPKPLREPRALETDAARIVRQVEFAASGAQSRHALNRLVTRCTSARRELADADAWRELDQVDRVASWAFHALGRLDASEGEHATAVARFRLALEAHQENLGARHDLALALVELNETDEALQAFSEVLAVDPNSVSARRNRADLHLRRGAPEAAIADCDVALRGLVHDPTARSATLVLRGAAFHSAGRMRDAAADFGEALRITPGDPDALRSRGHVFAEGGFYEQAITDYTAALDADPESAETYRSLAWVLATCPEKSLRNPQVAVEAAWRARRILGRDDFLTLDASAAAHAAAGDYAEAIRFQQRALMTAGDASTADARARLRRYEAGRAYFSPRPAR